MANPPALDTLSDIERSMLAHAANGDQLLRTSEEERTSRDDMDNWGSPATIRASVLRHLLIFPDWPVQPQGVRLCGVRIIGFLNLASAELRCPLHLTNCLVDSGDGSSSAIVLDYASAPRLSMTNCQLPGISGERVMIRSTLDLSGSVMQGPVNLNAAKIDGALICRGARLEGCDQRGRALLADGATLGGSVFLSAGFMARGSLSMYGAQIAGQLSCNKASVEGVDQEGRSLLADRMRVGRSVLLAERFSTEGAISLLGANIEGQLKCKDASINGADSGGRSILADRLAVGASIFLNGDFVSVGAVRLTGARITGQLNCKGATLKGSDAAGRVLIANNLNVSDDVYLGGGFTAGGEVDFSSSVVGGSFRVTDVNLDAERALTAVGLRIGRDLDWSPARRISGVTDLRRASTAFLVDAGADPGLSWPPPGRLRLEGFTYDGFAGDNRGTWQSRLEWLRLQYPPGKRRVTSPYFATQPYEHLTRVYRNHGQESDSRRIAVAKRNDLRRYGANSWTARFGSFLLDKTIKHGYQPLRAVVLLALIYLSAFLMFFLAQQSDSAHLKGDMLSHSADLIVPAKDVSRLDPPPSSSQCISSYPCFYPAGLALDTVVPIISTRQAENWRVNGRANLGAELLVLSVTLTMFGWAFSTLAVIGYTGLVRKD